MGAPHDSLRLFMICRSMEWSHLPAAGGLFDQDPKLLDDFQVIWGVEGQYQEKQRAQQTREAEAARQPQGGRGKSKAAPGRTVSQI